MRRLYIVILLLLAGYNFTFAQQQPIYQYFNFSELECGGRYLTGNLFFNSTDSSYSQPGFNEGNRFFLEIAATDSEEYRLLPEGRADAGRSGSARFLLPDTLVIGKSYKVRMSSTSPRYTAQEPTYFTYAYLLQPFTAKFQQQQYIEGEQQVSLRVNLEAPENRFGNSYQLYPYKVRLSDGSTFVKDVWKPGNYFELKVLPADSLTVYRISEITNQCGVKGNVEGEAVVVKSDYLQGIYIRTVSGIPEICKGVPLGLKIETRSTSEKERFRVEFSDPHHPERFIPAGVFTPDMDKNVWVKTPEALENNDYLYCRVVQESTGEISHQLFLKRVGRTRQIVGYLNQADMDRLMIVFYPQIDMEYPYSPRISSVVVNGRELRQGQEISGGIFILPLPSRDTSFVISHASTSCESVPFEPAKIEYIKEKSLFYTLAADKKEYCEGEEAEIRYALSDPGKLDEQGFYAVIYTRSYLYDKVTGKPTWNDVYYPTLRPEMKINRDKGTLSVKIPQNLYSLITGGAKHEPHFMYKIILSVGYTGSGGSAVELWGNRLEKDIRIRPELSLTASEIQSVPGQTLVPLKFRGGELRYELSNGWTGEVRQLIPDCYGCPPVMAGEMRIPVPVNDDTVIRVKSVNSACGTGTSEGETRIRISRAAPYLNINEAAIGQAVCAGKAFDVPFSLGNLDGTEVLIKDDAGGIRKLTEEEVRSGSFQLTLYTAGYRYETSFWLQAGNIRSNTVKVRLEETPHSFRVSVGENYTRYSEGDTEVYQVLAGSLSSPSLNFSGSVNRFEVNGVHYVPYHNSGISTQLYLYDIKQAPLYTLNSVTNTCGTVEMNWKFRIQDRNSFLKVEDVTEKNFIPNRGCPGAVRFYEVSYSGSVPVEDRLTVELLSLSVKNAAPLVIPFQKEGNKLRVEVPDGLEGSYNLRVKSEVTGSYSDGLYLGYFRPMPEVKLVSITGKTEIMGTPGTILRLESNYGKAGEFSVKMNTGEVMTSTDFGIYYTYSNTEGTKELVSSLQNYGRSFTPAQTTTYRVESVFNHCGQGKATGSVRVIVAPAVKLKYSDPSLAGQAFCSGAETEVSLTYTDGFPKDTLLGLYLHKVNHAQTYRELATFKDLKDRVSFRLPDNMEQGIYSLQVRKRSRANADLGFQSRDSVSAANLDSPLLSLTLITPPQVRLSGNTEIFSGESADLKLVSLDSRGEEKGYFLDGVENYFTLSNGATYSLTNSYISVSPPVTETFLLKSVRNICGNGKGYGQAIVVVHPRSGKRLQTRGFARSWPELEEWYYQTEMRLCAGARDSLDVILYGWEKNEAPGGFRVVISDGQGGPDLPVTVFRSQEVSFPPSPEGGRILRLWLEIPETIRAGDSYRIKAVSEDPEIPSVPTIQPGMILERPTASLSGSVLTQAGGQVEALVKFTGTAPWFFTVTDESERIIFNTIPTAVDSSLREYSFSPLYTDEYLLKLKADKAKEYKVSRVYNWSCGYGKTEGIFSVELILGNEQTAPVEISLYPNPVQDQLRVDLSRLNTDVRVEIFDLQGKLHLTETYRDSNLPGKQTLDLRGLSPGTYLVRVRSGGLQQTKRILKR